MDKNKFDLLVKKHSLLITEILKSNVRFYRFEQTVKWKFTWCDNIDITAAVDRKTNIIDINILFVDFCVENNEINDLEYFLLHEIRHVFQHLDIMDYLANREYCAPKQIIEKWIEEEKNYITALDKDMQENEGYPKQDIEMDAYAFSYAVMEYKYGKKVTANLYLPPIYAKEFFGIVEEWLMQFQLEKLEKVSITI